MSIFVVLPRAGAENEPMRNVGSPAIESVFARPLTETLLSTAGILPGMHVLVLGRGLADLALLVAERVGRSGGVTGIHDDPAVISTARRRAAVECFDHVNFETISLEGVRCHDPVDAVIGRFVLMYQRDPIRAIRRAALLVRDGGRIAFQEWHLESVQWTHTSDWPAMPAYRAFARAAIERLRRRQVHADMGLRLLNVFCEAGLPRPEVHADVRAIPVHDPRGYGLLELLLHEMLPAIDRDGVATAFDPTFVDAVAQQLQRETAVERRHVFLPLQVGAWVRL